MPGMQARCDLNQLMQSQKSQWMENQLVCDLQLSKPLLAYIPRNRSEDDADQASDIWKEVAFCKSSENTEQPGGNWC